MKQLRHGQSQRALIALLSLAVFLFMQAMAISAELHHHCHEHADEPGHQCVVTHWQQGTLDHTTPEAIVIEAPIIELPACAGECTSAEVTAMHLRGGLLAHGPPRGP